MADQIQPTARRLAYIDWMRGLACVLMFQTHCYDSWMSPEAKKSSSLTGWSKLGGTLPAPLFIFLAGVSFALVTEKLREKGIERNAIAKQTILRGAEVFGMGLLFRVQEFALGHRRWRRRDGENSHSGGGDSCGGGCGHGNASALDDASAEILAVAHRILLQRCAHLRSAAAVALSVVSLVGVRLRGSGGGILSVFGLCQAQGSSCLRGARGRGNPCLRAFCFFRFLVHPSLRRLRLLAQQSGFCLDALRHSSHNSVSCLRVVPVGLRAERF